MKRFGAISGLPARVVSDGNDEPRLQQSVGPIVVRGHA